MREELNNLKNNALAQIIDAKNEDVLEELRITYLGRNGNINELTKEFKNLNDEEKKEMGILLNETKKTIEEAISSKLSEFKKEKSNAWFDYTIPGKKYNLGHIHLISQTIEEISNVFEKIGFVRVRYPEVEWDWYAFGALNFPVDHPARDEWETFFIDTKPHPKFGAMLLTPHTSNGQVREMSKGKLPIKMLNIAKCYRRQSDVSHTPMFHQFEGLVIDQGLSIANLKGVLDYFVRSYFGESRKSRIRPYHFEFTEPSFEVDVSCGVCKGAGCKLCKEGWLEMGGAGMVHPQVLRNCKIDPSKYNGFAFGWGVERVLMMKEGIEIDDLRLLYSNKLEFLEQF